MFSVENLKATYIQKIKNSDSILDKATGVAEISGKGAVAGLTTLVRHVPRMIQESITPENLAKLDEYAVKANISRCKQALNRSDLDSEQKAGFRASLTEYEARLREIEREKREKREQEEQEEKDEYHQRFFNGEDPEDIKRDIEERKNQPKRIEGWFPSLSSERVAENELKEMRGQVGELEQAIANQQSHISQLQNEHKTLIENHELSKTKPDNEEETTVLYYKIEQKHKEIEMANKELEKLKKEIRSLRERIGIYVANGVQEIV